MRKADLPVSACCPESVDVVLLSCSHGYNNKVLVGKKIG
jgi:hypothetical protein